MFDAHVCIHPVAFAMSVYKGLFGKSEVNPPKEKPREFLNYFER